MSRPVRFSVRAMLFAMSVVAVVTAFATHYPNAGAIALILLCIWGLEAALVRWAGRGIWLGQGWTAPSIALAFVVGALLLLAMF